MQAGAIPRTVENVHSNTTIAFRMNDLSGSTSALTLYAYGADGKLAEVDPALWSITDEDGEAVTELTAEHAVRAARDRCRRRCVRPERGAEKEIKISVVLSEVRLKEGSGAKSAGAFFSLSKPQSHLPVSDIMKETGV